ncbi:MAG: substrate-binding domain-containing protein [Planctomycetota bacterium]
MTKSESKSFNGNGQSRKRVLLWIEASRAYGRGCLLGIAAFVKSHQEWDLVHFDHVLGQDVPDQFAKLRIDGLISRTDRRDVSDRLGRLGVPVVDLRGSASPVRGQLFDTDPSGCAALAFEHFWNRGFRNMAFCGYRSVDWSDRRRMAFVDFARFRGIEPSMFVPDNELSRGPTMTHEVEGELHDPRLTEWLARLPKPVAILAANDVRGRQILSACAEARIPVPEQVAVLGIDNDDVVCELANPSLSSIQPDTFRLGFDGAKTLDRLMDAPDFATVEGVRLIPPRGVVERTSTATMAIDDAEVALALEQIRKSSGAALSVDDLARSVRLSRATLERRFRAALGRSPRQQIDQIRLARARSLVRESGLPLRLIAEEAGYSSLSRFSQAYQRHFHVYPDEDRAEHIRRDGYRLAR